MKRLFHATIFAGILFEPATGNAQEVENVTVVVRVYNYAATESSILKEAQRQAARILKGAGAAITWVECPATPGEAEMPKGCAKPLAGSDVVLKLLPEGMAVKLKQTAETFGFAVSTSPAGLGSAFVFVKQAEQLAFHGPFPAGYDTARAVLLAHLISHEIGHLLLGPGGHSQAGIMSFPWSGKVLRRIATAHLSFTGWESEVIRKRLAASGTHARQNISELE